MSIRAQDRRPQNTVLKNLYPLPERFRVLRSGAWLERYRPVRLGACAPSLLLGILLGIGYRYRNNYNKNNEHDRIGKEFEKMDFYENKI
jgi:hypothetical protein